MGKTFQIQAGLEESLQISGSEWKQVYSLMIARVDFELTL